MALKNLQNATLMYLNQQISSIINSDYLLHPDSINARNSLLLKSKL
jgi:HD superfamily phosphohydrolase YqeK